MRLRTPCTSALEKIALSERLPPGGPRSLNLRDRDRDFFAPADWPGAPQRQRLPIEGLAGVGIAGVVRCRRFEVQAAADLLAAELSSHDRKHLVLYVHRAQETERVARSMYARVLVR